MVINRDHIPSMVILSENISTKRHHQSYFGTKALFFVPFTRLFFCQIWVSFSIFRKDRGIETLSRHRNIVIIPNECKMKQGLLEISPETKDISLDYSKILNSLASKRNKKQCLRPKLSLMVAFGRNIFRQYYQRRYIVSIYDHFDIFQADSSNMRCCSVYIF